MTFGDALEKMKEGQKVARAGWNGKSMWIALTPGSLIPVGSARPGAAGHLATEAIAGAKDLHEAETKTIRIMGHIDMRAADGSLVIGWLASQTDMLAEDWSIVE